MRRLRLALLLLLATLPALPGAAGVLLQPEDAPEWRVSKWINGDPGALKKLQGKIVVIEFFQLWCPACNRFSIPLFKRWHEKYADRDDIVFVSIHTVFEGHDEQTPERLREFVAEKGIEHSVGIDAYARPDDRVPVTMDRFETQGTPHVAIVDTKGKLVFSHFGPFDPAPVEAFLDRMLKESAKNSRRSTSKPASKKSGAGKSGSATVDISGRYLIDFEQTEKSCGRSIRPMKLPAEIRVDGDRLQLKFTRSFLGLNEFSVGFNRDTGSIESRERRRIEPLPGQVGLDVNMELDGELVPRDRGEPVLSFEVRLEKVGDDPGWDCRIEAKGLARRVGKL